METSITVKILDYANDLARKKVAELDGFVSTGTKLQIYEETRRQIFLKISSRLNKGSHIDYVKPISRMRSIN